MERGQIIEQGTHDELIASGGIYCNIHQTLSEMETAASATMGSFAITKASGGSADE
jgi:ABC-type multidrug transport system fused ATPase/permease subunit